MKTIIYWIVSVLFVGLMIFNTTHLNFSDLFADESFIALMSIIALLCGLILLWLLYFSKKILKK